MNSNNPFDSNDEELLEPGSEDEVSFEYNVRLTRNQLNKPMNDLMRYAVGVARSNDSDEFSYTEFSEKTPYDSNAADVAQLVKDGFLDVEFFTTERLESDNNNIPQTGFTSPEEVYEDNLHAIEEADRDFEDNKLAMPGTRDATISIGELGKKYIEETEIGYSGEQAVEAYNRSQL